MPLMNRHTGAYFLEQKPPSFGPLPQIKPALSRHWDGKRARCSCHGNDELEALLKERLGISEMVGDVFWRKERKWSPSGPKCVLKNRSSLCVNEGKANQVLKRERDATVIPVKASLFSFLAPSPLSLLCNANDSCRTHGGLFYAHVLRLTRAHDHTHTHGSLRNPCPKISNPRVLFTVLRLISGPYLYISMRSQQ